MSLRPHLAAFGTPIPGLIPIFQTVSPRTPVNKGNKKAGATTLRLPRPTWCEIPVAAIPEWRGMP